MIGDRRLRWLIIIAWRRRLAKLVRGFDLVEAVVLLLVHVAQMNLTNELDTKVALDEMLVDAFAYLFHTCSNNKQVRKCDPPIR